MAERTRMSSEARREARACYLFISPWILGFILFTAGPVIGSLVLSLTSYTVVNPPTFVGLANYVKLFTGDPLFYQSLKVTALYTAGAVPLCIAAALLLAVTLNQRIPALSVLRTIYYLPAVISGVAVSLLWLWILNPDFGLINLLIWKVLHVRGPAWVFSEVWVLPSFILMSVWGLGGTMVLYLAALQSVSTELYEACSLDGGGRVRRFRHITLPMISPTLFFTLVTGVIGSFQVFTQAYVMTRGGPGYSSYFYVLYLYQNAFQYFRMGYAAAQAWILFAIILALTVVMLRSASTWVYYEAEAGR